MAPAKAKVCTHQAICIDSSEYGREIAGFKRIPPEKRLAAATRSGRIPDPGSASAPEASTFPGPLVLPEDDLATSPNSGPQSLRAWVSGDYRNPITPERKTLYVADLPAIDPDADFVKAWAEPDVDDFILPKNVAGKLEHPATEDVMEYLRAFYHPLPVKRLPAPLRFVRWDEGKKNAKEGTMIGLATGPDTAVGVRVRRSPDEIARMQLNLNDVLDALLEVLPKDAFASVMLVEQDLYEDEDDDFCCGRAFGGSRISVVSSFRYQPVLDAIFGVEVPHMWPASHCAKYVEDFCLENAEDEGKGKKRKRGGRTVDDEFVMDLKKHPGTAMGAAVAAAKRVLVPKTEEAQRGMWFARVARTAAHELGHCFGIGHCIYYACVMQGTGGLGEDARQPPYLCPVCEARIVYGLGEMGVVEGGRMGRWAAGREQEVERERMEAMLRFCEEWKGVGMFAGYAAWLENRLKNWTVGEKGSREDPIVI